MPLQLPIALLGHPVLRTRAKEVLDPSAPDVQSLVDDLFSEMIETNTVGLASPQMYQSVRVFVMRSRKGIRFPNAPEIPPFEVINPEVVFESSDFVKGWEGCASMPGYRAMIRRPQIISARWTDHNGRSVEQQLNDLAARVFLHELDHLDGIMFIDRMDSIKDLVSEKEMAGQPAGIKQK